MFPLWARFFMINLSHVRSLLHIDRDRAPFLQNPMWMETERQSEFSQLVSFPILFPWKNGAVQVQGTGEADGLIRKLKSY